MRVGAPRPSSRTQSSAVQATSAPARIANSVRRRAHTRRQPTTRVVPTSSSPTRDRPSTPTSAARTSQVRPRSRVPGAVEAALRRVEPGQVLRVAQQDGRPEPAVGRRPRRTGRGTARSSGPARGGGVGHGRPAGERDRASRARRCAVPSCGAVWRCEPDVARASGIEHDQRDGQALVLVGGVRPRVVELVEDVGVDPARAPLAVVRLGGAVALDGHVVRVDLGRGRRRTGSAARGGRRRRRPAARGAAR